MGRTFLAALLVLTVAPSVASAQRLEQIAGYAEYLKANALIVDGQRVIIDSRTRFTGNDGRDAASTTLGAEVKVRGARAADGSILAQSVAVRRNGMSLFERSLRDDADAAERQWLRAGEIDDPDDPESGGRILQRGRHVARAQRVFDRLVPPYLDRSHFRLYVVENNDWNAFAMANGSIWVFTGLLEAMDDDELAVVLGHELAHVTHEHSRRTSKFSIWTSLLAGAATLASELIEDETLRTVAQVGAYASALAVDSAFSRDAEDQADRVGLRYAFEGGFDVSKAPVVWQRFEEEYGSEPALVNFFLSGHSRAPVRRSHLQQQIAWNYRPGADVSLAATAGPAYAPVHASALPVRVRATMNAPADAVNRVDETPRPRTRHDELRSAKAVALRAAGTKGGS